MKAKNLPAVLATVAFAGLIGLEGYHYWVMRTPWAGFTFASNHIALPLIAIWCFSIAAIWSTRAGFIPFLLAGPFVALVHSIVLSAGGNPGWNLAFFLGAVFSATFTFMAKTSMGLGLREKPAHPGGRTVQEELKARAS